MFIPMPKHGDPGFEWSFFLPTKASGGKLKSLILLVIVNRAKKKCVAFRFEDGSSDSRHGYAHVQFVSNLKKSGLAFPEPCSDEPRWIPEWLPSTYPAFPVPARNWTEMFFAMVTAVHGRRGGIDSLVKNIFESVPKKAQMYMEILDGMLCKLDSNTDSR